MSDSALQTFPIFEERPTDEYVEGWHQYISETGYPERFDYVSTSRPGDTDEVVLLSGELKVPTAKRGDHPLIPCPICSPDSPKFKIGRMAWFPQEKVVRFIGHDCAAKHFGENYRVADKRFKLENLCHRFQRMWAAAAPEMEALERYADKLAPIAKAVEFSRVHLDDNAPGFASFLLAELGRYDGQIYLKEDTGVRERGQIVFTDTLLGTVDGMVFVSRNFRPHQTLLAIREICADIKVPLPNWEVASGEDDAAHEIINRGRRAEWMFRSIRKLRQDLEDARNFLRDTNLALLERWGRNAQSPFASLVFRREQGHRSISLRAETFAGAFYCNLIVPVDFFGKPIPSPKDPDIDGISMILEKL